MKTNNSKVLALISVALSIGLLLGAFAIVWLVPREAAPASAQNGGSTAPTATAQPSKPATADTVKPSQITVRGTGSISVKPDVLMVNIGVNIQDSTIKAAQTRVSRIVDGMVAKLKAAGLTEKDYRTIQYSIEPAMDYNGDKAGVPRMNGFRVINMLEITFRDPLKAPDVMDELVTAGANTVYNVAYTFSDPNSLTQQAYDKAVKDAEARATRLAGLSGLKLGKIVSVTESSANLPGPVYGKDGMGGGGSGPIYSGQQTVQVDLIVTYEAAQ